MANDPRLAKPKLDPTTIPQELREAWEDLVAAYHFLADRGRAGELNLHAYYCPKKPFRHLTTVEAQGESDKDA